jgi:hypothetical protein
VESAEIIGQGVDRLGDILAVLNHDLALAGSAGLLASVDQSLKNVLS